MAGHRAAPPSPARTDPIRELVDSLGAYVRTDEHGVIVETSELARRLFGVPPEELVGNEIATLVAPEHRRRLRQRLARLRSCDGHETIPLRFNGGDGVPFDGRVSMSFDAHARPAVVHWLVTDVPDVAQLWELNADLERRIEERSAELEHAYRHLDRRRAYLETIVARLPVGLVLADAERKEVILVNDEAERLLGGAQAPAVDADPGARTAGGRWRELVLDSSPLERALAGETVESEEIALAGLPDASDVRVEVTASPVYDSAGAVVAAVALFQDVTERERRRRAAAEFIANAAHELRTPIAAVASALDVLESGAKHEPDTRDRFLGHINREVQRLVRLTRALLVLARAQSGTEAPRIEIIEAAPLLREVASGLRPAAGVRVTVRCRRDLGVLGNRGLLEQALTSIAANAARHTRQGRIVLSASQQNGRGCIRVADTGPGMNAEELLRSGERFFRGESEAAGGFGLGLAIAHQAVVAMAGELTLDSTPGEGTIARISLPAVRLVAQ